MSSEFLDTIKGLRGGISETEATYLRDTAAGLPYGWIVEVGSFRGKSAYALYHGAQARRWRLSPDLYCIEPHEPFRGVYGGEFSPEDRAAYYRVMIETGAYRGTSLVGLTSEVVSPGWKQPLAMVFIDGDHHYEGVARDAASWERHVVPGGLLVFDDATDEAIGPHRVIAELLASGRYVPAGGAGKIIALRKLPQCAPPGAFEQKRRRILVLTWEMYLTGGLMRFERIGRILRAAGHELAFCSVIGTRHEKWSGDSPILDVAGAWNREWDATMLPGRAGFDPEERRELLATFTDARFGLRVQHILNDRSPEAEFLALNRVFHPHLVVANNTTWGPGSFAAFQGNEFHTLVGAVDVASFREVQAPLPSPEGKFTVGGQARKDPLPLVEALGLLPDSYCLRLFGDPAPGLDSNHGDLIAVGRLQLCGPLAEAELPGFYGGLDAVAAIDTVAGWSNVSAEAMAAGVPLICNAAGNSEIAVDGETAVVVPDLEPASIASAIERMAGDAGLRRRLADEARKRIQAYDWGAYSHALLGMLDGARDAHYFAAPELGLHGKWPGDVRLNGLAAPLAAARGRTVLDIGCAEGVISRAFLAAGAVRLDGIDADQARVRRASALCDDDTGRARFFACDLDRATDPFEGLPLLPAYQLVLYLGVHHHLQAQGRGELLRRIAARCSECMALRTPAETFRADAIDELLAGAGFELEAHGGHSENTLLGDLWVFRRRAAAA